MVQCPRDTRCLKEKGHKGFCQFKGVVSGDSDGKRVTRHTGAGGSTRVDRMKELAAKREQQHAGRGGRGSSMQDDDDEGDGDWDDEDVEYQDFGMTQAERRAARGSHGAAYEQGSMQDEDAAYGGEDWSGPAAPPECIESIRLARQRLELWQLEPFFDETVVGCIVRIGLGQTEMGGSGLYRAAEVVAVKEMPEQPYTLGTRRSTKRLQLEFGECRRSYPMTSVSNQPLDALEMASFQQAGGGTRALRPVCGPRRARPPDGLAGLRPLVRPPERRLSSLGARRGLRSSPPAAEDVPPCQPPGRCARRRVCRRSRSARSQPNPHCSS